MDAAGLRFPDNTFDVSLCRGSMMFFPSPLTAAKEMQRVLKPGGRVAISALSSPERNPWTAIGYEVIRRRAGLPQPLPNQPGTFSLGAPGKIASILKEAQFRDVQAVTVEVPPPVGPEQAAELWAAHKQFSGTTRDLMSKLPPAEAQAANEEITSRLGDALKSYY